GGGGFAGLELVELLALEPPTPQYLPEVVLYRLRQRTTGEERVALLRRQLYLVAESQALQHLYAHGARVLPDDAGSVQPELPALPSSLSAEAAHALRAAATQEQALDTLAADLGALAAGANTRGRGAEGAAPAAAPAEAERGAVPPAASLVQQDERDESGAPD